MIIIRKRTMVVFLLAVLFLSGFFSAYLVRRSQVKIGHHYLRLNPFARVDPKKEYTLRLWDYNLPISRERNSYRRYIQQLLSDFKREYPNIRVELKLIDLVSGEKELQHAITQNRAPDVFCSFNSVPEYHFPRQIPVGPFLSKKETMAYPQPVRDLYTMNRVLCSFPRWITADIWVGNRGLLEAAGLDISKIQNEGWDWEDLLRLGRSLPKNNRLMAGNPVNTGYMTYFEQLSNSQKQNAIRNIIELKAMVQKGPKTFNLGKDSLAEFAKNHCLLLAGVRPLIYLFLKDAAAQGRFPGVDPVILPAPNLLAGQAVQFVDSGVVNIYRNRYTKGDDHLRAAILLGRYISTYQNGTDWFDLGVYPVGAESELPEDINGFYTLMLKRSVLILKKKPGKKGDLIEGYLNGAIPEDVFQREVR